MESSERIKLIWKILSAFFLLCLIIFLILVGRGFWHLKSSKTDLNISGNYFDTYFLDKKINPKDSSTPAAVQMTVYSIESNHKRILSDFKMTEFPSFNLRIYSDPNEYYQAVKKVDPQGTLQKPAENTAEGTTYRSEILFFYLPKAHLSESEYPPAKTTPPHEFVHLVQYSLYGKSTDGIPPTWFREGVAVYEAQQLSDDDRQTLGTAKLNNQLLSFEILQQENSPADPKLYYATVGLFYEYLVNTYGKFLMNGIFSKTGTGTTFDRAFNQITREQPQNIYNKWINSL